MKKQVKEDGIQKKIKRIKHSLDRIESGMCAELSIEYCTDYIGWLVQYKKVPKSTWLPLCEQATRIFENRLYC